MSPNETFANFTPRFIGKSLIREPPSLEVVSMWGQCPILVNEFTFIIIQVAIITLQKGLDVHVVRAIFIDGPSKCSAIMLRPMTFPALFDSMYCLSNVLLPTG